MGVVHASIPRATLADLAGAPGKAELIRGRVVPIMPTGHFPNLIAGRIFPRLAEYAESTGLGVAYTDNIGFVVPELSSGRESFSPDASFYTGPIPADRMRFVRGAPDFAVEVRSEGDYTPSAELAAQAKREDYFEAGVRVVWDVDPESGVISRHRPGEAIPTVFGPGEEADAEPAAPGWRVSVDWIMS